MAQTFLASTLLLSAIPTSRGRGGLSPTTTKTTHSTDYTLQLQCDSGVEMWSTSAILWELSVLIL
ncbi:hypothetical protein FRC12_023433, partial [Ceratobasidium sp. 428]